ncbi:uncharacterized protein LOC133456361 [Cololabis saira]|uniref:uncharacterized protein LOC133456361 n=1 Tax=Cololabis saira TaxID=129043 RepID=UPI002AD52984|nr:uncharacterized protein LOC133456361 [Cololabis saira]
MSAPAVTLLLLLSGSVAPGLSGPGPGPDSEPGRLQLRRVRGLAAHPRYGECWSRALQMLDTRCRDMTSEVQGQLALRFTHCHLESSGRDFPSCPEGSEVSRCTAGMDAVAFNTYTEFFTHTHSMCQFLQSEAWQSRAETTMFRLTETSAGVAEELQSTREMAKDLMEAQIAALEAQKEILSNGEELREALRDSTQGLQSVFSDLSSVSREQQVALSEIFNRVAFLQSFLLMEAHSVSSCCYNAAALCTSFLITSTPRSSRARLVLLALVCLNFYLERKIYQFVMNSDHPEHLHLELLSVYVGRLRRFMVCVGVCVLLLVCVRYRDPVQQSLQVLQQLKETQRSLQEALQRAESLWEKPRKEEEEDPRLHVKRRLQSRKEEEEEEEKEEDKEEHCESPSSTSDVSHIQHFVKEQPRPPECTGMHISQNASVQNASRRRPRSSPTSPLVYSILVEDKQPRYSLRSRRSDARLGTSPSQKI